MWTWLSRNLTMLPLLPFTFSIATKEHIMLVRYNYYVLNKNLTKLSGVVLFCWFENRSPNITSSSYKYVVWPSCGSKRVSGSPVNLPSFFFWRNKVLKLYVRWRSIPMFYHGIRYIWLTLRYIYSSVNTSICRSGLTGMKENFSSIELSPASTLWIIPVVQLHNSLP